MPNIGNFRPTPNSVTLRNSGECTNSGMPTDAEHKTIPSNGHNQQQQQQHETEAQSNSSTRPEASNATFRK